MYKRQYQAGVRGAGLLPYYKDGKAFGEIIEQEKEKPASLKFDKLLSTMMAGPGMTVEGKVLEAMNKVRSFIVKDEHTAALLDENGAEALTLVKQ